MDKMWGVRKRGAKCDSQAFSRVFSLRRRKDVRQGWGGESGGAGSVGGQGDGVTLGWVSVIR